MVKHWVKSSFMFSISSYGRDFPAGPVKNLPYGSGGAGSIPGTGTKIP